MDWLLYLSEDQLLGEKFILCEMVCIYDNIHSYLFTDEHLICLVAG